MRRKGSLLGFLIVVVSLLGASSAHAAFPGQNGKIAYAGVNTVYPDGRDRMVIGTGDEEAPGWSADGTQVVASRFAVEDEPYEGVIVNADGSGTIVIAPNMYQPTWSPDGTRIAYAGSGLGFEIRTISPSGIGQTTLTPGYAPAWSPNGQKIAFTDCPAGNCDIYTVNPNGTGRTNLTGDSPLSDAYPDWSPDGTKLVFQRGPAGGQTIWTMNSDGTNRIQVGTGVYPVWSPDGQQIAYMTCEYQCPLRRMNVNGTNDRMVVSSAFGPIDWQACATPCPSPPPPPYDTPASAGYARYALVPNFRQTISTSQCQARGGTPSSHGPPLSFSSCNPPGYVPGTAARMGFGFIELFTQYPSAEPADNADVVFDLFMLRVRTPAGAAYDPNPAPGGTDITVVIKVRITDTGNGGSGTDPGTVVDFDLSQPAHCLPEVGGSSCFGGASIDAFTPGAIKEGKDTVIQSFRVRINDSGTNGVRGDSDDRTFATQGIYIP